MVVQRSDALWDGGPIHIPIRQKQIGWLGSIDRHVLGTLYGLDRSGADVGCIDQTQARSHVGRRWQGIGQSGTARL